MGHSAIADVSTAVGSERSRDAPDLVPALTIVSHPFARRAGERLLLDAVAAGGEVSLSRNSPDFTVPGRALGRPLDDPFVSRKPIRFAPGTAGGVRVLVEPGGTPLIAGSAVSGSIELAADELVHGVALELAERVVLLVHMVERKIDDVADPLGMVGASGGIRRVRAAIQRVVDLTVPVLIRGETGTGKELVARAIHDQSPRCGGPFVTVNLGALPRELAAAELFGSTRGAYTGSLRDRDGLFRTAHGGTLFLDEVGEAPPEVQASLLRALETGEVYPVGAERPVSTSVRVIAATDADLEERIEHGQFKAPLLHRLAGFEIRIPPLRERREDIGPLFFHFAHEELQGINEAHRLIPQNPYAKPWLPANVAATLVRYAWPGNIRQLRNLTRQLVIEGRGLSQLLGDSRVLEQLPGAVTAKGSGSIPVRPADGLGSESRRKPSEVTTHELLAALQACDWDLKAAAERLRIPRPSIYDLIERTPNIRTAGDLGTEEITRCFDACSGDLDAMVTQLQVSKRALGRRLRELGLGGVRQRPTTRPPSEPDGDR